MLSVLIAVVVVGDIVVMMRYWSVALDKLVHRNDAKLVPLDLLVQVVGLEFSENLNHCPLELGFRHQLFVVGCRKSFLFDLNSLDSLHLVLDDIHSFLLCHELSLQLHDFFKLLLIRLIKD